MPMNRTRTGVEVPSPYTSTSTVSPSSTNVTFPYWRTEAHAGVESVRGTTAVATSEAAQRRTRRTLRRMKFDPVCPAESGRAARERGHASTPRFGSAGRELRGSSRSPAGGGPQAPAHGGHRVARTHLHGEPPAATDRLHVRREDAVQAP